MQSISIQIQPEHLSKFDQEDFLKRVRALGRSPEIDVFTEQKQQYLQFHFFTEMPKKLWSDLRKALYDDTEYAAVIAPISIAVYEDEDQPDEYLYLHHFDKREKISSL
jgi:hypothetical protein